MFTSYPSSLRFVAVLIFIAVIRLSSAEILFSQSNNTTDSLQTVLKKAGRKAKIMNEIAEEFLQINPNISLEKSIDALEIARNEKNELEEANALFNIASAHISLCNYDTAKKYSRKSFELFQKINDTKGINKYNYIIANLAFLQGDLEKSFSIYEDIFKITSEIKYWKLHLYTLINMGRIYWLRGNYDAAHQYYNKALMLSDSLHNPNGMGMAYLLTGVAYQDQGYYELAIENLQQALRIYELMNYYYKLPYALNYLGSVYFDLYELEKSLVYYKRALKLYEQNNDAWGMAVIYRYMGRIYNARNESDSAKYYYQESLNIALKLNDRSGEMYSRRFLGLQYLVKKQYHEAMNMFQESMRLAIENKNSKEIQSNIYCMGMLYEQQKKWDNAAKYYLLSIDMADSLKLHKEKMIACDRLAFVYESKKDYPHALLYYKQYKTISDTIFSEKKRKNMDELQLKYETEKKNNEINRLRLEEISQEARMKNQRIFNYSLIIGMILVFLIVIVLWYSNNQKKKANREIETLLKEIHHRVRNNLQTISSLLSLQSSHITDNKIRDAVKEGQNRVKSMALIHQMLYQQEKLSRINFREYIKQLTEAISQSFMTIPEKVEYQVHCEPVELDVDTAIPLGLIVNELLVNAHKYAFNENDKGVITISLGQTEKDKYTLKIKDNGKGLPGNIKIEETNTLGLKLVSLLVRQIRGEIKYQVNKGTEFTIEFNETRKKT
jgi:two-component sensor histidine kinase/tetratricopeptide (TPR) repeat protein